MSLEIDLPKQNLRETKEIEEVAKEKTFQSKIIEIQNNIWSSG
jgi:hypothetical protein